MLLAPSGCSNTRGQGRIEALLDASLDDEDPPT
jgi:hypothetical protein